MNLLHSTSQMKFWQGLKTNTKGEIELMGVLQLKSTKLDPIQSYFTSITREKFIIDLKLPLNTSVWKNRPTLAVY